MKKSLLDIARELQAISKSGLTFSKDPFDLERFKQLEELAVEIIANHTLHSKESIQMLFSAEQGYPTPKLDVRAAVFKDNKILMVRERESSAWTLPGGYVDVNEPLSRSAAREVLEESGMIVDTKKVAAIFDHRQHGYLPHLFHFYKIYVVCDLIGGEAKPNMETLEVNFFSQEEVQTLELDPGRMTRKHVLRMFDHFVHPELPTDFD